MRGVAPLAALGSRQPTSASARTKGDNRRMARQDRPRMAIAASPASTPVHNLRGRYEVYEEAFAGRDAPFAFVDLDAMWANAGDLLRAAGGKPIRVASKSVRCRPLQRAILDRDPGFRGLMTFTLPETLWLTEQGFDDLLLAYPTVDRSAIAALSSLPAERQPALVVDSVEQLDLLSPPARVVIELDLAFALPVGGVRVGAKRSPVRTPEDAAALAREIVRRPGIELAGIMGYEAHIAGVGDTPRGKPLMGLAIRALQARSAREIASRRAAVAEAVVTEVTAGSGFYAPTLFDHYSTLSLRPAAMFTLPVVRKPSSSVATALGGGYTASGAPKPAKLPEPYLPHGLSLDKTEG